MLTRKFVAVHINGRRPSVFCDPGRQNFLSLWTVCDLLVSGADGPGVTIVSGDGPSQIETPRGNRHACHIACPAPRSFSAATPAPVERPATGSRPRAAGYPDHQGPEPARRTRQ